jgi:hypothetical protein
MPQTGTDTLDQDMAMRIGNPLVQTLPQPASYTTVGTLTYQVADIIGSIIVHSPATAVTATLPSAALLIPTIPGISDGRRCRVGDTIFCSIINAGAATITIVPGAGGSLDPNQAAATITAGTSKLLSIRVTNSLPGTEAYTAYS